MDEDGTSVWITVESGASENVVSEPCLPHVPTVPSKRSTEGVRYAAPDGTSMLNPGEEVVRIVTGKGSPLPAQHAGDGCQETLSECLAHV